MKLYARMSPKKRQLLLAAAQVIATTTALEGSAFADTTPAGGYETQLTPFDSKS